MYSIKPDPDQPGHQTGLKPRSPLETTLSMSSGDLVQSQMHQMQLSKASRAGDLWCSHLQYRKIEKSNILNVQNSIDKMRNYRGGVWLTFWLATSGKVRVVKRTRTLIQSSHTLTLLVTPLTLSLLPLASACLTSNARDFMTYGRTLRNVRNMINNLEDSKPWHRKPNFWGRLLKMFDWNTIQINIHICKWAFHYLQSRFLIKYSKAWFQSCMRKGVKW